MLHPSDFCFFSLFSLGWPLGRTWEEVGLCDFVVVVGWQGLQVSRVYPGFPWGLLQRNWTRLLGNWWPQRISGSPSRRFCWELILEPGDSVTDGQFSLPSWSGVGHFPGDFVLHCPFWCWGLQMETRPASLPRSPHCWPSTVTACLPESSCQTLL